MKDINRLLGQTVEGTVVCWSPNSRGWSGFLRVLGYGVHGSRSGIYFKDESILSNFDPENIQLGMRAQFRVIKPAVGMTTHSAVDIDFYI